ncbi:uncharacterized protein cubi_02554 [Cryptosporidium ubiquitum]|uniref:Uncharacterized protein n=1 Tax=Cryptosporidium ubiquitum TaxID=857276 RepID=A0A1J4MGI1_9CRYT|nr:uncharacterized protein cubi_02554 [Cryptosporidium ubiquitum]OII73342.1 hypothetical protein cubi_02554 [Cryptosporidium ubiquitum]
MNPFSFYISYLILFLLQSSFGSSIKSASQGHTRSHCSYGNQANTSTSGTTKGVTSPNCSHFSGSKSQPSNSDFRYISPIQTSKPVVNTPYYNYFLNSVNGKSFNQSLINNKHNSERDPKKPNTKTSYYQYYLNSINGKPGNQPYTSKYFGYRPSPYFSQQSSFKTTDRKPLSPTRHTSSKFIILKLPSDTSNKMNDKPRKEPFIRPNNHPKKGTSDDQKPSKPSGIPTTDLSIFDKYPLDNYEKITIHSKEIHEFRRVNLCCIFLQDIFDLASKTISNMSKSWTGNSELLENMLIQATTAFSTIYSSLYTCKSKLLRFDPNNKFALNITPGPIIDEKKVLNCEKDLVVQDKKQFKSALSSIRKINQEIKNNSNFITKVTKINYMDQQCKEFVLNSCRNALIEILKIESKILSNELEKTQLAVDIYTVNELLDESTRLDFDKYVLKKPMEVNEDEDEDDDDEEDDKNVA